MMVLVVNFFIFLGFVGANCCFTDITHISEKIFRCYPLRKLKYSLHIVHLVKYSKN